MVDIGIDLSEFYQSVEWDILEVPAERSVHGLINYIDTGTFASVLGNKIPGCQRHCLQFYVASPEAIVIERFQPKEGA